jgi:multidrug resistance protein MdtO
MCWQPQLRALFVMRIALLKYRLQAPGFEMPDAVRLRQEAYDDVSARMLEEMADRIDKPHSGIENVAELHQVLDRRLHDTDAEALQVLPVRQAESFVTLLHGIDTLTNSLAMEVNSGETYLVVRERLQNERHSAVFNPGDDTLQSHEGSA